MKNMFKKTLQPILFVAREQKQKSVCKFEFSLYAI